MNKFIRLKIHGSLLSHGPALSLDVTLKLKNTSNIVRLEMDRAIAYNAAALDWVRVGTPSAGFTCKRPASHGQRNTNYSSKNTNYSSKLHIRLTCITTDVEIDDLQRDHIQYTVPQKQILVFSQKFLFTDSLYFPRDVVLQFL